MHCSQKNEHDTTDKTTDNAEITLSIEFFERWLLKATINTPYQLKL